MAHIEHFALRPSRNRALLPLFLCPLPGKTYHVHPPAQHRLYDPRKQSRRTYFDTTPTLSRPLPSPSPSQILLLPRSCPGCGAFTQSVNSDQAGFYSINRKSVKAYIARGLGERKDVIEKDIFEKSLDQASPTLAQELVLADAFNSTKDLNPEEAIQSPVCNRCHDLLHHHIGVPIIHPTLQSIQQMVSESPYKYNHIYHILDAADFPLSVIPQLHRYLSLTPQRSHNRRAKIDKFYHGRKAELSFIITRSDLLAPQKEQVDKMMPYLIQVLRDALGSSAGNIRLGNVRCVSSKRGWWTKDLKKDIWDRGGGGWMVGKVNVGKSNLFECVFPKGRNKARALLGLAQENLSDTRNTASDGHDMPAKHGLQQSSLDSSETQEKSLQEGSLLPPVPTETAFPVMPVVSSLPGTTASPIRLSFGEGKGELVDLPGLSRSMLENYVKDDHKLDLVMRQRLKPVQFVLRPNQSLLLGGLIRITSKNPDIPILAYPFVPLNGHVTSTEKAIGVHSNEQPSGISTITKPGVGAKMASAGTFYLNHDVTKQRSGPLTSSAAVGLNPKVLPFVIFSTDILIEGCGWVELVAQVRKRDLESHKTLDNKDYIEAELPAVEIFSPEGKHIGVRRPMNAWLLGGQRPIPVSRRTSRPRRSMKGVKKAQKRKRRA